MYRHNHIVARAQALSSALSKGTASRQPAFVRMRHQERRPKSHTSTHARSSRSPYLLAALDMQCGEALPVIQIQQPDAP